MKIKLGTINKYLKWFGFILVIDFPDDYYENENSYTSLEIIKFPIYQDRIKKIDIKEEE